jgi:glycosyltransferase involved in cell wall biosynthesis
VLTSSPTPVPHPTVSVIMLAYDHAQFIRQAIHGVLAQVTDFQIELLIVDDASRDDTAAIARGFQSQRPDIITLLSGEQNVGMQHNTLRGLNAARGRYIAFCEGDDYWCDPQKLARQVAYLQDHPNVSLVFHDVQVVDFGGHLLEPSYLDRIAGPSRPRAYSSDALAVAAYIPTASAVFRNTGTILRANFATVHNLDSYMFAMLGEYGDAHEVPGVMAAYRFHGGGAWSSLEARQRFIEQCWTYRAVALDIDPGRVRFVVPALRPRAAKGLQMALSNRSGV